MISGIFIANYSPSSALSIVLNGITNPSTISVTDSFQISIFYVDNGVDEVDEITTGVKIQASPNPNLSFQVNLNQGETGVDDQLQFVMETPQVGLQGYGIVKGSTFRIGIPIDFQIYDANISSNTCLQISGFSDEISCSLKIYTGIATPSAHHYLTVTSGFDSRPFNGIGSFAFNISEIRNPKTSQ